MLSKRGICIAVKEKLVKDSGVAEEIAYDSIVLKLLTKTRARGKKINLKKKKLHVCLFSKGKSNTMLHLLMMKLCIFKEY